MVLMGKRNWYMPRWLDKIVPHVSIEGAEFFKARDMARVPEPKPASELVGSGSEQ
jgi:RND superfamily putative drug exporter